MPPEENTLVQPVADTTPPVVTGPVEIDPDDAEVDAARAAVTKPTAEAETTEAKPTATATPAAAPAAEEGQAEDPEQVMIPKWRFDQQLAKEREAAARIQGELEAYKLIMQRNPGQQQQPQAKSAEEQLKDIRAERRAIAEKFDNGEINRVQEAEAIEALSDREYAIREEQWKARNAPQQPKAEPTQPTDDMYLDGLTKKLADDHPYADLLSTEQLDFLRDEAARQLMSEGVQFVKGTLPSAQRFVLRERIAVLSDSYGPAMTGKSLEQIRGSNQPAPKKTTTALSPEAQARQAKLELARNAPPNLNSISGPQGSTEPTEDQLMMMNEEDIIAKIPKSTRDRMMGLA